MRNNHVVVVVTTATASVEVALIALTKTKSLPAEFFEASRYDELISLMMLMFEILCKQIFFFFFTIFCRVCYFVLTSLRVI